MLSLIDWLDERQQNAFRIARTKTGHDRDLWFEDASYFLRAREVTRSLMDAAGDDYANVPIRTYLALKLLRAWNHGTAGFDGEVVSVVNAWFDGGLRGPVPWPQSPFFAEWAGENGLSKVGVYVGFRFEVDILPEKRSARK